MPANKVKPRPVWKFNLRIDPDMRRPVEQLAAGESRSVNSMINRLLRAQLTTMDMLKPPKPPGLRTGVQAHRPPVAGAAEARTRMADAVAGVLAEQIEDDEDEDENEGEFGDHAGSPGDYDEPVAVAR